MMLASDHWASEREPCENFSAHARFDDSLTVVAISGELDLEARGTAIRACISTDYLHVVVDLAGLTFMDCAGYRGLMIARKILERRGGSLSLVAQSGEPLRLLNLLEQNALEPAPFSRFTESGDARYAPTLLVTTSTIDPHQLVGDMIRCGRPVRTCGDPS